MIRRRLGGSNPQAAVFFIVVLEIACSAFGVPGELDIGGLVELNAVLLCLHLFIGGIRILSSYAFDDAKRSVAFGPGILTLMFVKTRSM